MGTSAAASLLLLGALAAGVAAQDAPAAQPAPKAAPAAKRPAPEVFAFDKDRPFDGQWVGLLQLTPEQSLRCVLRIEAGPGGSTVAEALADYGRAPATDVVVKDGKLSLAVALGPKQQLGLSGTVSADGQTLTGEATSGEAGKPPAAPLPVTLRREPRATAMADVRAWTGKLTMGGKSQVSMTLVLGTTAGGRLVAEVTLPSMRLDQTPLEAVTLQGDKLAATMPGKVPVALELSFGDGGRTLKGVARVPGQENAVALERDDTVLAPRAPQPAAPGKPAPAKPAPAGPAPSGKDGAPK